MKPGETGMNFHTTKERKQKFLVEIPHTGKSIKEIFNDFMTAWTNKMRKKRGLKEIF